jgi:ferredoxin
MNPHRAASGSQRELRLVVDPIACDGAGLCAELVPELVGLDDWGYPIVRPRPVSGPIEVAARRAVGLCPKLALSLRLVVVDPPSGTQESETTGDGHHQGHGADP